MNERRLLTANRPSSSEAIAILLATVMAPGASLIVNLIGHTLIGEIAALERTMAHPAMAEVIAFCAAVWHDPKWMTLHACLIGWLGVVPVLMLLRAFGRLRLWTALPAGVVLPLSTVSAVTLLMWQATSATTSEKFVVYGVLIAMTVPAAVAAAAAFWSVSALVEGCRKGYAQTFLEPLEPRST